MSRHSPLLPPDDSLVPYDEAAAELGVTRRSIFNYVKQGRLQRHHSGRGVTRDSLQGLVGNKHARSYSYYPRLTERIVAALVPFIRLGVSRERVAHAVFTALAQSEETEKPES